LAEPALAVGEMVCVLRQAGCTTTEVISNVLVMRDLAGADLILSLRANLADAWWVALEERDRAGAFFAAMTGVIVGAKRE
jgi:hypothetical protein